jgi:ATPase subunit of ABC transporter with duplicated ATPase domains
MSHKPIVINNITVAMGQKICFEDFSTQIQSGKQILIMGRNGAGKSTLLKVIQNLVQPIEGIISISSDIVFGYVPQTVLDHQQLSGGQRFNQSLSYALSVEPDVLLLDEPTNHLDLKNKRSLTRMLQRYYGTLVVVSHDLEILTLDFDEIWHVEHGIITIFKGNYDQYCIEHGIAQQKEEDQRDQLQKDKRQLRKLVQDEQSRAGKSKSANKRENDRNILGAMKDAGSSTAGKNMKKLAKVHENLQQKMADNFVHKKIEPKFNLDTKVISSGRSIISIIDGSCCYTKPVINNMHLQMGCTDRIAIIGDNGSGKSTIIKALLRDLSVAITGQWSMPSKDIIGYLDQHYSNLNADATVTENIQNIVPDWDDLKVRKHLNDFLFSSQLAVSNVVKNLSGGEKARLSLACMAAQSPSLLLLDEITNNIDLETREHIIEVLQLYPGAMIIVSHDPAFLQALSVTDFYEVADGCIARVV